MKYAEFYFFAELKIALKASFQHGADFSTATIAVKGERETPSQG